MSDLNLDVLLADTSRTGTAWCQAYTEAMDRWLLDLFDRAGAPDDVALCAVGGYGRGELAPHSDVDVMLLHRGRSDIGEVAEGLWYPLWDEGLKVGHAVRTPKEALQLAASDLDTATSLLQVRHLAGAADLTEQLAGEAGALWRKRSRRWLGELAQRVAARHRKAGEVAFLLEPDLKEGRGGLRDVHAVRWAEAADRVMLAGDDSVFAEAYETLLAVRVELHRATRRRGDVLLLQEQDAVAAAVGVEDADVLMHRVATAGRAIAWRSDEVWDRIAATDRGGVRWRSARDRSLGTGIVLRDGRVAITGEAEPAQDPALPLRVAVAAARQEARIDRSTLLRLADEAPPMPEPWPAEARGALVDLLVLGPPAIPVLEALDQVGLWVRLLPEWGPNRNRPQRNAYHRFTVDRHLVEAVAEAGRLTGAVDRPDLLVIGTLLHDIGKGYPGDHTEVGVDLVGTIGPRLGYPPEDVAVLVTMVREHLLLPDVATRRDLSDPATIDHVASRVGTVEVLHLLAALTEADSRATGPAAWGAWKAELVAELVARTAGRLGAPAELPTTAEFPDERQWELLRAGEPCIVGADDRLTVVVPDRPGLFSRVAGALTLNGLDVLDAAAYTHDDGLALETFRVESSRGPTIAWDRVVADVERALSGQLALHARVVERARTYARPSSRLPSPRPPEVRFDLDISASATVVEVQAPDAIGILYRATRALAELDLDIRSAKVQTLGHEVVDSFYVVDREGRKVDDPQHLAEIERALRDALAVPL